MDTRTFYYHIVKTIGRIQVVNADSISKDGFCIEAFHRSVGGPYHLETITIYKNGKAQDFCFNGITFPFVYNAKTTHGSDIYGGIYNFSVEFDVLDANGQLQHVALKKMYGGGTPIDYFFKFLYNLSCCKSINQCFDLYENVFDIYELKSDKACPASRRRLAIQSLKFIDEFIPILDEVKDKEFIQDLKDQINYTQRIAQDVVANTDPEIV